MGHVPGRLEVRLVARYEEHAVHTRDALLDHRVLRVDSPDAVNAEGVVVEVGRQRAHGDRPDALLILGQLPTLPEVSSHRDLACLRREDAEGDPVVGRDLGGLKRVVGRALPRCELGLRAGQCRRGKRQQAKKGPGAKRSRRDYQLFFLINGCGLGSAKFNVPDSVRASSRSRPRG